ncbi:putative adhesin [Parendozoicomonas callyspongiae]|uniref:putative adhesin n=1 Tax=Parendozoicomonas callyspongiae TaxID=2942213 RepID=UPI0038CD520B
MVLRVSSINWRVNHMADFVFFGHGGRGEGTSRGTYVVPKNCTIHFFEEDGQLLNMSGA